MFVKTGLKFRAIGFLAALMVAQPVVAQDSQSGDWEFGGAIYMWGANITAETSGGSESQIPFYKLLDNLQMAFMGALEARKDEWSIVTDVIYMDVKADAEHDRSFPGGRDVDVTGTVELKSWIVSPTVRYALSQSENSRFELLGGLRYLYLDVATDVYFDQQQVFGRAKSDSYWDFIVGMHGRFGLNDHWFIPVYADVGTGDSKNTWQAMAGIGYQFDKLSLVVTYRYLDYEFDDDSPVLGTMTMKGPIAGLTFRF